MKRSKTRDGPSPRPQGPGARGRKTVWGKRKQLRAQGIPGIRSPHRGPTKATTGARPPRSQGVQPWPAGRTPVPPIKQRESGLPEAPSPRLLLGLPLLSSLYRLPSPNHAHQATPSSWRPGPTRHAPSSLTPTAKGQWGRAGRQAAAKRVRFLLPRPRRCKRERASNTPPAPIYIPPLPAPLISFSSRHLTNVRSNQSPEQSRAEQRSSGSIFPFDAPQWRRGRRR